MQKLQNIWRFEIEEARRKAREFRTFGLDSRGANKQGKIMNGNRMKIGRSFAVSTRLRLDSRRRFASLWTQVCGSSLVCRQQWPRRKWRQRVAAIYREPRIPISETFQLGTDGVTVNFLFIKLDVSGIPFLFFFPPLLLLPLRANPSLSLFINSTKSCPLSSSPRNTLLNYPWKLAIFEIFPFVYL